MPISTINQNGLNAPLTLTAPNLGTPSAINLSNATALPKAALPSGSVLQVIQTSTTTVESTSSTSTFAQITNLNTVITPLSSTSKILIMASVSWSSDYSPGPNYGSAYFQLSRGGSAIGVGPTPSGSAAQSTGGSANNDNDFMTGCWAYTYLDSPASTSAQTYGVKFRVCYASGNVIYTNQSASYPGIADYYSGVGRSSLIVMEIAQ